MLRQLVTVTWEQGCFCTAEEGYGHPCILLNLFLNAGLNGSHAKHCLGTWDFITDAGIKKVDQWTSQLKEVFMWCPTIYWLLNWVIVWFYVVLIMYLQLYLPIAFPSRAVPISHVNVVLTVSIDLKKIFKKKSTSAFCKDYKSLTNLETSLALSYSDGIDERLHISCGRELESWKGKYVALSSCLHREKKLLRDKYA